MAAARLSRIVGMAARVLHEFTVGSYSSFIV